MILGNEFSASQSEPLIANCTANSQLPTGKRQSQIGIESPLFLNAEFVLEDEFSFVSMRITWIVLSCYHCCFEFNNRQQTKVLWSTIQLISCLFLSNTTSKDETTDNIPPQLELRDTKTTMSHRERNRTSNKMDQISYPENTRTNRTKFYYDRLSFTRFKIRTSAKFSFKNYLQL